MPASPDLVPISLRLDKNLLTQIDEYCKQTGQGRSSFLRSAAVAVMEGSVSPSNAQQGPAVDQEAREGLLTLAERIRELEDQVSQLQTLNGSKVKANFTEMLKTEMLKK